MRKLERKEMKNLWGAVAALAEVCNDYPGQTTWICGSNGSPGGTNCTTDICFCDGRPPVCHYPTPCSEL